MVFRTNPSLGPDLDQVVKKDNVWYEGAGRLADGTGQAGSPQLGDLANGSDGGEYVWVEASGAITITANGTQVTLTVAGDKITAATGTGGFYAPKSANYDGPSIAAGDHFWARKGTTPLA